MFSLVTPPQDHSLGDLIANIFYAIGFFGLLVFLIGYLGFFHWMKTPAGRVVAGLVATLLLIATTGSLRSWLGPDYWGRDLMRDLSAAALAAVGVMFPIILFTARRRRSTLMVEPRTPNAPKTGEIPVTPVVTEPVDPAAR